MLLHAVERHDQGAQRISMAGDQQPPSGADLGHDLGVPETRDAPPGVGQALAVRPFSRIDVGHPRVPRRMMGIIRRHCGWAVEVAAPPAPHLVFADTRGHRCLVLTLQGTVVAFVEPPVGHQRHIRVARQAQHRLCGLARTRQARRVRSVEVQPPAREQLARANRLGLSDLGQTRVGPAGEAPFAVPLALGMADHHHHRHEHLVGHRRPPHSVRGAFGATRTTAVCPQLWGRQCD